PPLGLTCQLPTQPAHNHRQAIARGAGMAGVIDHREPDRRTGIAIVPLAVGRRSTVIFTADKRRWAPQTVRSATVKRTASHMDGRGQARIAGIGEGGYRTAGMTARPNLAGIQFLVVRTTGAAVLLDQPVDCLTHLIARVRRH